MSRKPTEDWTVIRPGEGESAPAVAGALLAMTSDVSDVRTVMGGTAFLVPPELAAAYLGREINPTPTPRRRGRAKKGDAS